MIKDLNYLKWIKSKEMEELASNTEKFIVRNHDGHSIILQGIAGALKEMLKEALEEREKDLRNLPEFHRIAVKDDSYEALCYYEFVQEGRTYGEIDEIIRQYKTLYNAPSIKIKATYYPNKNESHDISRKKIYKAVKQYIPAICSTIRSDTVDPREITHKRLKQFPYIRALIDLYSEKLEGEIDQIKAERIKLELEMLRKELKILHKFIEGIDDKITQNIFIARYKQGKSWEEVAAVCIGYGSNGESVRKIAERYTKRYNTGFQIY